MRIAITGSTGFIGNHIYMHYNFIKNQSIEIINKSDFNNTEVLKNKIYNCDLLIHTAYINRSTNSDIIKLNIELIKLIKKNLVEKGQKTWVIFTSSTQIYTHENDFSFSKKLIDRYFKLLVKKNIIDYTNLIIPNLFGPLSTPYKNTFIATFCYNILNNIKCEIENDRNIKLLYISNFIKQLDDIILNKSLGDIQIDYDKEKKVSNILKNLEEFNTEYVINGIIPYFKNEFHKNLFLTFYSFLDIYKHNYKDFLSMKDERGEFCELVKSNSQSQFSISITKNNIERGNHFHTRKIEKFIIIKGSAEIKIRKITDSKIHTFKLDSTNFRSIDIPLFHTHSLTKTSDEDLIMMFWISEFYNSKSTDTYSLNV